MGLPPRRARTLWARTSQPCRSPARPAVLLYSSAARSSAATSSSCHPVARALLGAAEEVSGVVGEHPPLLAGELERHVHLRAITLDLAVLHLDVEFLDLRDTQIAERLGRAVHGRCRGLLPRVCARAHQLDDLVDALRHLGLLAWAGSFPP